MRKSLRKRIRFILIALAVVPLVVLSTVLALRSFNSLLAQAVEFQSEIAQRVAQDVDTFIEDREQELFILADVYQIQQQDREEQLRLLSGLLAVDNLYEELALLDSDGHEEVHMSGLGTVGTEFGEHDGHAGLPEFERPKATGEIYFSPVGVQEVSGEPFMTISIPLIDLHSGEFSGVLLGTFHFKPVWDLVARADVAGTGLVYVVDSRNKVIAHRDLTVVLKGTEFILPEEEGLYTGLEFERATIAFAGNNYGTERLVAVAERQRAESAALAINNMLITVIILLITIVIASIWGIVATRSVVNPIQEMALTAQAISDGDLAKRVTVDRLDEIGTLAEAFNSMTAQVSDAIVTLEERVRIRTQALETSIDVGRRISTVMEPQQLVEEVVLQVQQTFNYYHVHIYLIDNQDETMLHMAGGTGAAGQEMLDRNHKLSLGQGLVGQAGLTLVPVLVPDVTQVADWLPNPLLPDTKSELAVPILSGDVLLGVLDVQHNIIDGLSQTDVDLIELIASQVAVALRNASLYQQAQERANRELQINEINQKILETADVEQAMQIAVRELGQVMNAKQVRVHLQSVDNGRNHQGQTE